MRILGISAYFHDSAAALIEDGEIVAAGQEERFSRVKHDADFPSRAVRYCLAESPGSIDAVAFYDKPVLKFHRILETYLSVAPKGRKSFHRSVPLWLREKIWIDPEIRDALAACEVDAPEQVYFPEHHLSHAASAFFPSPHNEAAVLTIDGVGEWATASLAVGEGEKLEIVEQLSFPHSLGLLYSAMTYFTGFKVNSGEYKLMGLAPYGRPTYKDKIFEHLMDLRDDGSFRLDMDYFAYLSDLVMTSPKLEDLFDGPPRMPESKLTQREMDIARSVQEVTEEIVLRMARHAKEKTGKNALCLAGGVALNCTANGKLARSGIFDDIWIQPAAGDAGGAIGAALSVWFGAAGGKRKPVEKQDSMHGAYLGPEFGSASIQSYLDEIGCVYEELSDDQRPQVLAQLLVDQKVLGLFQGRMEFGPRALGNRSIIADPRTPTMQSTLNQKIKFRESFRPFAPSCLEEHASEWFELDGVSPYMLHTTGVAPSKRSSASDDVKTPNESTDPRDIGERLADIRSEVPAITHVDFSARVQTVSTRTNPDFHAIISAFNDLTGVPMVINTSFNVRGEPIVCTPEDAFRCFQRTEMDCLVLGPFLIHKDQQPELAASANWLEPIRIA